MVGGKRGGKRRVVLASGVFDLLHPGHVRYLEEAKKVGGEDAKLVVVVARDNTVEKHKGKKPIIPEDQRRVLVESLKVVDEAILGYEGFDIAKTIKNIKPDVIALGYDQDEMEQALRDYVEKHGLNVEIVRIRRFGEPELNSSSKIKQRIIECYKRK